MPRNPPNDITAQATLPLRLSIITRSIVPTLSPLLRRTAVPSTLPLAIKRAVSRGERSVAPRPFYLLPDAVFEIKIAKVDGQFLFGRSLWPGVISAGQATGAGAVSGVIVPMFSIASRSEEVTTSAAVETLAS